jgi:FK506-binding nuclear protein
VPSKESTIEQVRNKAIASQLLQATIPSPTATVKNGVIIEDISIGTGAIAARGRRIKVNYVGRLKSNNKIFDSSSKKPFAFILGRGEVITGWEIGCEGMRIGGARKLTIPPEKAYGKSGAPPTIPPNATLVFDITLLDVK